ncbi:Multidrug and toxin extrusion protein 2 [Pteropus alecto]|uniref:Multidrug and toxin extrusion protein 2 n=1 Tax=Pteropus alecto TaxID=9402 RepID=L5KWE1_PTEAL|nr:Multidrug and toxin extrusion protein 2 [Pteropus alecto]
MASTALRPGPEKTVESSVLLNWLPFASAVATGSSLGISLTLYSRPKCHLDLSRTPEVAHALSAPSSRLSGKQLVIHRGAALGAATATTLPPLQVHPTKAPMGSSAGGNSGTLLKKDLQPVPCVRGV